MISRLIPGPVITHCMAFQNLLSLTHSFLISSNLSTLFSRCQHLQFRPSSHLLYLITQGLCVISAPIFFSYFAYFAYCLLLFWIFVLSIYCIQTFRLNTYIFILVQCLLTVYHFMPHLLDSSLLVYNIASLAAPPMSVFLLVSCSFSVSINFSR